MGWEPTRAGQSISRAHAELLHALYWCLSGGELASYGYYGGFGYSDQGWQSSDIIEMPTTSATAITNFLPDSNWLHCECRECISDWRALLDASRRA